MKTANFFTATLLIAGMFTSNAGTAQNDTPILASGSNAANAASVSSVHNSELTGLNYHPARLEQIPEVSFNQTNVIRCFIPSESEWVFVSVFNDDGIEILTSCLTSKGLTEIPVNANTLKPGNYSCSLIIDEKTIDSKQLIVTK